MPVKQVPTLGWTRGSVAATILLVTQKQREEIAARVRGEMERQGLTNVSLARKARVADKTVSRIINARTEPRYNTIERVAAGLGKSELWLRGVQHAPLGLDSGDGAVVPKNGDTLEERLARIEKQFTQLLGDDEKQGDLFDLILKAVQRAFTQQAREAQQSESEPGHEKDPPPEDQEAAG